MNYRGQSTLPFIGGLLVLIVGVCSDPLVMIFGLALTCYGFYLMIRNNPAHQETIRELRNPTINSRAKRVD